MSKSDPNEQTPAPRAAGKGQGATDRMVDGVPVRTYRGSSLSELAPRIRAELGDSAMILRQREGVTGGIAGFFAKRTVEVDVAVLQVPGAPGSRIDVADGPSVGPGSAQSTVSFDAFRAPLPQGTGEMPTVEQPDAPREQPQPTVPFSQIAEQHGLPSFTVGAPSAQESAGVEAALAADQARQRAEREDELRARQALMAPQPPQPHIPGEPQTPVGPPPVAPPGTGFTPPPMQTTMSGTAFEPLSPPPSPPGTPPPAHDPIHTAPPQASWPPAPIATPPAAEAMPAPPVAAPEAYTPPEPGPTSVPRGWGDGEAAFDAGRTGADTEPVAQSSGAFAERLRTAGLESQDAPSASTGDPVADLAPLHAALIDRGLPEQIAGPIVDDTLCHRVPLQPDRSVRDLLVSELARRIPTAPLAGRSGQAVAFVGSSGAGKTRAIARLAAAYGAANRVPVACVTLQGSGQDGLLATSLAPFGIAVHTAPDAHRALERITALRRHALVLIDTPGVSPGDRQAVERLGATLSLLELDQVALCLPVVLAAPIARRVLRAMRPLGPTVLVATHADEADLLGGVVAVAIDRRVPLAYVSAGAGRGSVSGADAHEIASAMTGPGLPAAHDPRPTQQTVTTRAIKPIDRARPTVDPVPSEPTPATAPLRPAVDVNAGAGHLAAPWIVSSPLRGRRR